MQKTLNLSNGLRVVGVAALLVGVYTAAFLYQSFGAILPEKIGYALAGVIFALAGGLLLPVSVALWNRQNAIGAAGAFLMWVILILPLGLSGHAGFFSVAQSDLAASGLAAEASRAKLEALELQTAQYKSAGAVDLAALQSSLAALQAQENAARAALAACPKGHNSKCVQPKTAALGAIQAEIQTAQAQIDGAGRLADLATQRATAAGELAVVSSGGLAGSIHPLFTMLGDLFNVSPIRARSIFLAWSAVALECVAAIFFILAGALTGNGYQLLGAGVELPETVPALNTGATITADGLALLHRGEVVLNVAAVEVIERLYPGLLSSANNGKPLERENVNGKALNGKPLETVKRQTVGTGAGLCRHCGGGFVVTRKDRHYCGDDCRAAAWESRTGAKLVKGKGKKAA